MNPFSVKLLSNLFFRAPVTNLERLHSKTSLLKTRKASNSQNEIYACTLQNSCSKIGKAQAELLCQSPVLETLLHNFIKTGLQL